MCTVTFLPDKEGGFILTSNRDEKQKRERANIPAPVVIEDQKILFPKDPKGGGSWIAVSENGRTACLLNGAFEVHIPDPPYSRSRGLVLLDSFRFQHPENFISEYEMKKVEPFTLIIIENNRIWEIRWDGNKKHLEELSYVEPSIWASPTLYPEAVRQKRKAWFEEWLTANPPSVEGIRQFHHFAGEGDVRNDFIINRDNEMLTLSITSILYSPFAPSRMIYEDLLENKTYISQV